MRNKSDAIFYRGINIVMWFIVALAVFNIYGLWFNPSVDGANLSIVLKLILSIVYLFFAAFVAAVILTVLSRSIGISDILDYGYSAIPFALGQHMSCDDFRSYIKYTIGHDSRISKSFIDSSDFNDILTLAYAKIYRKEANIWYRQIDGYSKDVVKPSGKHLCYKDRFDSIEIHFYRENVTAFPNWSYRIYIDLIEKDRAAVLSMLG